MEQSLDNISSIFLSLVDLQIDTVLACGGLAKNQLYIQEHADIIGKSLILPLPLHPLTL